MSWQKFIPLVWAMYCTVINKNISEWQNLLTSSINNFVLNSSKSRLVFIGIILIYLLIYAINHFINCFHFDTYCPNYLKLVIFLLASYHSLMMWYCRYFYLGIMRIRLIGMTSLKTHHMRSQLTGLVTIRQAGYTTYHCLH